MSERKSRVRETVWKGDRGEGTVFYRLDPEKGSRLSRSLYISYRADGREQVVSTKTDDLEDAKRELRRLTRNRDNAREGLEALRTPRAERMTIRQLVEAFLYDAEHEKKRISIRAMRNHATPMLAVLGVVRAVDLKPEHVRRYKETRRSQNLSAAKISRELEILKAAFNHAAKQGAIRVVPVIELPKVSNARKVFFPLERVPELLSVARGLCVHAADFLGWLSYSGMRPKAIRRLRWTDLDAEDWVLTLAAEDDKNKFGREIALAGEGREIIERRPRGFSGLIFGHEPEGCTFGRGGHGRKLATLTERHVREVWKKALEKMELPCGETGFRPYDLKKTALRAIRRSGVPEERAMHFSGHKTASTFRRYDIVARDDNREDAERVSAYRARRFADKEPADADKRSKMLRIS